MAATGSKKAGRNKDKCKRYKDLKTREKNKVKRVLKSSGRIAAEQYALEHGLSTWAKLVIK